VLVRGHAELGEEPLAELAQRLVFAAVALFDLCVGQGAPTDLEDLLASPEATEADERVLVGVGGEGRRAGEREACVGESALSERVGEEGASVHHLTYLKIQIQFANLSYY